MNVIPVFSQATLPTLSFHVFMLAFTATVGTYILVISMFLCKHVFEPGNFFARYNCSHS